MNEIAREGGGKMPATIDLQSALSLSLIRRRRGDGKRRPLTAI